MGDVRGDEDEGVAWVLRSHGHASSRGEDVPVWLSIDSGRTRWDVRLEGQDLDAIRGLIGRYVDEAWAANLDASPVSRVRRWARANGIAVADRGRVPRRVVEAYNAVHWPKVSDPSGRSRRGVTSMVEVEERSRAAGARVTIRSSFWLVDEDGARREVSQEFIAAGSPRAGR